LLENGRALNIGTGLAYLMATGTVLGWSIGIVIGRGIFETTPPIGLSFWRWFITALCLVPWVIPRWKAEAPFVFKAWKKIAAMGLFMIGASTISMLSVNYTTATNVSLVNAGQPLTTALIAWLVFKDKLSPLQTFGIVLGAVGIVAMVSRADLGVLQSLAFNAGDLLMLIAIVGYGSYANTLRTVPHELGLTVLMFTVTMAGCIEMLPFYIYESLTYMPMPTNWTTIGWVAVLAIVTSLFPIYWWNAAVSVVGVNRSAIFVNLLPVFGATLAIVFLDEQLYLYHVLGTGLVFLGILAVVRGHQKMPS
jgi:drug/metabolite transporter (DMT)-like permease